MKGCGMASKTGMGVHDSGELFRQNDVLHVDGVLEQRRDLLIRESGDTAADARDQELILGMLFSKRNKLIHVGFDGLHPTLHGGNGVALSLQAHALAPHRTKAVVGHTCGPAAMRAREVTAKHKDLVRLQFCNSFRGVFSGVHWIMTIDY